jgi:hypothetical protein
VRATVPLLEEKVPPVLEKFPVTDSVVVGAVKVPPVTEK